MCNHILFCHWSWLYFMRNLQSLKFVLMIDWNPRSCPSSQSTVWLCIWKSDRFKFCKVSEMLPCLREWSFGRNAGAIIESTIGINVYCQLFLNFTDITIKCFAVLNCYLRAIYGVFDFLLLNAVDLKWWANRMNRVE